MEQWSRCWAGGGGGGSWCPYRAVPLSPSVLLAVSVVITATVSTAATVAYANGLQRKRWGTTGQPQGGKGAWAQVPGPLSSGLPEAIGIPSPHPHVRVRFLPTKASCSKCQVW